MIRLIAAHDEKLGIANDSGIPWHLPKDAQYFREKTKGGIVVMGGATYREFDKPLPDRQNLVLTHELEPLRSGFQAIRDLDLYIKDNQERDIWIIGGASLFAQTISVADELYITRVKGDFHCTKFFPDYSNDFLLVDRTETVTENNIDFSFEIWARRGA